MGCPPTVHPIVLHSKFTPCSACRKLDNCCFWGGCWGQSCTWSKGRSLNLLWPVWISTHSSEIFPLKHHIPSLVTSISNGKCQAFEKGLQCQQHLSHTQTTKGKSNACISHSPCQAWANDCGSWNDWHSILVAERDIVHHVYSLVVGELWLLHCERQRHIMMAHFLNTRGFDSNCSRMMRTKTSMTSLGTWSLSLRRA